LKDQTHQLHQNASKVWKNLGGGTNYKEQANYGEFHKVLTIDLKKERPEENEHELYFDIYIKSENLENGNIDEILKVIADDEIRAMFVSPSSKCIITLDDGGVDVIVDPVEKRDNLKVKYKEWLSDREYGM